MRAWAGLFVLAAAVGAAAGEEEPPTYDVKEVAALLMDSDPFVSAWGAHGLRQVPLHLQEALLEAIHHAAVDAAERSWHGRDEKPLPDLDTVAGARFHVQELLAGPGVIPPGDEVLLDEEAARRLRAAVEESGRVMNRWQEAIYHRQPFVTFSTNHRSYIADARLVGEPGNEIAEPVLGFLPEGETMNVRLLVAEDGSTVTVEMDAYWAHVEKRMRTQRIQVGERTMRIQRPVLTLHRAHVEATVPDGGWLLLRPKYVFGPERFSDDRALLVHVKSGTFARPFGALTRVSEEIVPVSPEEAPDDEPPSLFPGFTPR